MKIDKNFQDECMVECVNTGRKVIEMAESFRPDIVFMDIQMPGINGIEAMRVVIQNALAKNSDYLPPKSKPTAI